MTSIRGGPKWRYQGNKWSKRNLASYSSRSLLTCRVVTPVCWTLLAALARCLTNQWSIGAISFIAGGMVVKNLPARAPYARDMGSIPEFERYPWRRKWQSVPVLIPGEFHGQRSLAGYSPWGCKRVGHDWSTNTTVRRKDIIKCWQTE